MQAHQEASSQVGEATRQLTELNGQLLVRDYQLVQREREREELEANYQEGLRVAREENELLKSRSALVL